MSIPLLWSRLGRALLNSLMSTITRGVTCYKRKYIIAFKNWSNQPSLPELLPLSCCWMRQLLGHLLYPLLSPLQPGIGILKIKYYFDPTVQHSFSSQKVQFDTHLSVLWHDHGGLLLDQALKSFLLSSKSGQVSLLLHASSKSRMVKKMTMIMNFTLAPV